MIIPTRHLALVALLVSVPVSSWYIAYRPMNTAIHRTSEEIKTRTGLLTNFTVISEQYRTIRAITRSLEDATNETMKRIPVEADADQWLQSASDAAKLLGLLVRSVTTSGVRDDGEYKILPVDLSLNGSYENVYQLIQHFERMDRIARIDRMTIHMVDDEHVDARLIIHLVYGSGGDV